MSGAAALLVLVGLVTAAFPRLWWDLTSWQYRQPEAVEPSDAAFTVTRVTGCVLVGVGVFLGAASVVGQASEKRRAEAAQNPEIIVRDYATQVLREARRSDTSPRQLAPSTLRSLAAQEGVSAHTAAGFVKSGALTVSVPTDDPVFGPRKYCLVLPESADGQPSVSARACPLPVEVQRAEAEALGLTTMDRARTRGVSPRDQTLLREMAGGSSGQSVFARPQGLEIQFTPDPRGGGDYWCVVLPEQVDGTLQLLQGSCPATNSPSSLPSR